MSSHVEIIIYPLYYRDAYNVSHFPAVATALQIDFFLAYLLVAQTG